MCVAHVQISACMSSIPRASRPLCLELKTQDLCNPNFVDTSTLGLLQPFFDFSFDALSAIQTPQQSLGAGYEVSHESNTNRTVELLLTAVATISSPFRN